MIVEFLNRNASLDDSIEYALDNGERASTIERIRSALSRFSSRIKKVSIQIVDVEEKGVAYRLCRLSVRMKQLGSFAVESVHREATRAVSTAADRAAKRVATFVEHHPGGSD